MIKIKVDVKGDLSRIADNISRQLAERIYEESQKNIDEMDIVASGHLKRSGFVGKLSDGVWIVKYYMPYAKFIEYGTEPHMPPVEPLVDWANIKLGLPIEEAKKVAWAIAMKIAKEGVKPRPFFRNAIDKVRDDIKYGGVRKIYMRR